MIGMEEGILPHSRARANQKELEEERRLAFVGITRAQKTLILSKAQYRTIRGMRERTVTSPFLTELPQEMLDITDRTGLPGRGEREEQRESYLDESEHLARQFRRGTMVRHPQFGVGRIEDVSGTGQHTRAVVDFRSRGRKTLILQFARLEVVS
jgi:DNA helicase-2/ATP-dependent DNA helicase PcrA